MDIFTVVLSKKAKRDVEKVPVHIYLKLMAWMESVGHDGLSRVRHIPGYHDEPLKGDRVRQRSIRLSKAYRAIYIINRQGKIEIAEIIEVHKHDY